MTEDPFRNEDYCRGYKAGLADQSGSGVLQAVLDAIAGTLDPHSQIADHPNVKFAQMQRLKQSAGEAIPVSPTVTRLEVIDETGRKFTRWGCRVEFSYQDEGRTLKIFVTENPAAPHRPPSGWLTAARTCPNSPTSCADPHCREHRGADAVPLPASPSAVLSPKEEA